MRDFRIGGTGALFLLMLVVFVPASMFGATWKNVMLLDTMCSKRAHVMSKPTEHPRSCILECYEDGYGVVLSNGSFLKLDGNGNKLALDVLRAEGAPEENVRVNVDGQLNGDTIRVSRIELVR